MFECYKNTHEISLDFASLRRKRYKFESYITTLLVQLGDMKLKFNNTLLCYSLCCCLYISYFGLFLVFLFFCPISTFYANIPALYAKIPCYLLSYVQYRAKYASEVGWGPVGGVETSLDLYIFLIEQEL